MGTLRLIPPGRRSRGRCCYTNRFFVAIGRINGRQHEVSTGTADEAEARRICAALERDIIGCSLTWSQCAELYVSGRQPSRAMMRSIERVKQSPLAAARVRAIGPDDVYNALNRLLPRHSAATKTTHKKAVLAVINYVAALGLCSRLRMKHFADDGRPAMRRLPLSIEDARRLCEYFEAMPMPLTGIATRAGGGSPTAADVARYERLRRQRILYVTWDAMMQSVGITARLRLTWERNVDLGRRVITRERGDRAEIPEAVFLLLANVPPAERTGRIFPLSSDHNVILNWLGPARLALGIQRTVPTDERGLAQMLLDRRAAQAPAKFGRRRNAGVISLALKTPHRRVGADAST